MANYTNIPSYRAPSPFLQTFPAENLSPPSPVSCLAQTVLSTATSLSKPFCKELHVSRCFPLTTSSNSPFKTTAFSYLLTPENIENISITIEAGFPHVPEELKQKLAQDFFIPVPLHRHIRPIDLLENFSDLTEIVKLLTPSFILKSLALTLQQREHLNFALLTKKQVASLVTQVVSTATIEETAWKIHYPLSAAQILFCCKEKMFAKGTYLQKYTTQEILNTLSSEEKETLKAQGLLLLEFNVFILQGLNKLLCGVPLFKKEPSSRELSALIQRERPLAEYGVDCGLTEEKRKCMEEKKIFTDTVNYLRLKQTNLNEKEIEFLFFCYNSKFPLIVSLPIDVIQNIQIAILQQENASSFLKRLQYLTNQQFQAIDLSDLVKRAPSNVLAAYFTCFRDVSRQYDSDSLEYDLDPEFAYDVGLEQKSLSLAQLEFFIERGNLPEEEKWKFYTTSSVIEAYQQKHFPTIAL